MRPRRAVIPAKPLPLPSEVRINRPVETGPETVRDTRRRLCEVRCARLPPLATPPCDDSLRAHQQDHPFIRIAARRSD
jgi:hypothetical protein